MKPIIPLLSDSYKIDHYRQYGKDTENIFSYFESRNGARYPYTVFFGLQYLIKKNLLGQVVTNENIEYAKKVVDQHRGPGAFNEKGWRYILEKHNGKLPLQIRAVAEGTVVPINNVMMTCQSTDNNCVWLTNYMETLLTHVWYSSVVATMSRNVKESMKNYLDATSDNPAWLDFMLHDFGMRGVSSMESAGIGGAAHLINFKGTDTLVALDYIINYYNSGVCGYSVPATEHSVMTANGPDGEIEIVQNLLNEYPTGIISCVGDSYDIFNFAENIIGKRFKNEILNRDGTFVVRPDSGDPVEVVDKLLNILDEAFGSTINSKGYRTLNPKIRIIWGDGIDPVGINIVLDHMMEHKWAADNIVFGMGGGLLQKINRDTQRSAFKCSARLANGNWIDVSKNPIDKTKQSKKGRITLDKINGEYKTVRIEDCKNDQLVTVFENGELLVDYTFESIIDRAKI